LNLKTCKNKFFDRSELDCYLKESNDRSAFDQFTNNSIMDMMQKTQLEKDYYYSFEAKNKSGQTYEPSYTKDIKALPKDFMVSRVETINETLQHQNKENA
jgi:hypothetical protein